MSMHESTTNPSDADYFSFPQFRIFCDDFPKKTPRFRHEK